MLHFTGSARIIIAYVSCHLTSNSQSKIDYTNYYRNALLYLACLPEPSPLSEEEAQVRAYNLSIAALLGEKIYNFGELLLHPILEKLKGPDAQWLRELLFAMNNGDLDDFQRLSLKIPNNVTFLTRLFADVASPRK